MLTHEILQQPALRVMLLTPGLSPGGAERWMATLYRHRTSVDYRGIVSAGHSGTELMHEFDCPVFIANGEVSDVIEKVRQCVALGVDLIVYWGMTAIWELHQFKIPILQVSHSSGAEEEDTNEGHQEYVRNIGKSCAHFLAAVSDSSTKIFPKLSAKRLGGIPVIHNGIELERTRPRLGREWQREQWEVEDGAKLALFLGRLEDGKNAHKLCQSLEYLPEEWSVVLYGWGSEREKCIDSAPRGRLIVPQPRLSSLGDVYAACDRVVLPSRSEAFPLVMIEAWHAGRQLICSSFQTLSEIENAYASGRPMADRISLDPSPMEIAEAILKPDDAEMVSLAFSIAFQAFSASAMAARWETFFYHCVRQNYLRAQKGIVFRH